MKFSILAVMMTLLHHLTRYALYIMSMWPFYFYLFYLFIFFGMWPFYIITRGILPSWKELLPGRQTYNVNDNCYVNNNEDKMELYKVGQRHLQCIDP